jgi:hypothetical protein
MSEADFQLALIVVISVVTILLIVVALPVVLSMRQAARDRQFQHAERLKALELGQPLPGDSTSELSHGRGGAGIGVWVPIGVMGIALAATHDSGDSPAAIATWVAAGSVGVGRRDLRHHPGPERTFAREPGERAPVVCQARLRGGRGRHRQPSRWVSDLRERSPSGRLTAPEFARLPIRVGRIHGPRGGAYPLQYWSAPMTSPPFRVAND